MTTPQRRLTVGDGFRFGFGLFLVQLFLVLIPVALLLAFYGMDVLSRS